MAAKERLKSWCAGGPGRGLTGTGDSAPPLVLCIQLQFRLCDRTAGCLPPLTGTGIQPHRTARNRDTSPAKLSRSFDISDSAVKGLWLSHFTLHPSAPLRLPCFVSIATPNRIWLPVKLDFKARQAFKGICPFNRISLGESLSAELGT